MQKSNELKWELPGGKLEQKESIENAIKREIKEELGIDFFIDNQLDSLTFNYNCDELILIPFLGKIGNQEIILMEHLAYKWISLDDIDKINWIEADAALIKLNFKWICGHM